MGIYVMSKAIRKGDEILVSYGKEYWQARQSNQEEEIDSVKKKLEEMEIKN